MLDGPRNCITQLPDAADSLTLAADPVVRRLNHPNEVRSWLRRTPQ